MSIRKRLIKGTTLNFIAVAFNQGSTVAANIVVARILLKHGFGQYAMVQSTLLTVVALSQLAMSGTASKYIAEYRSSDPQRVGRIMGMCTLVSALTAGIGMLLVMIMSPWLACTILKAPDLTCALMIGSGYLFFSSINGYQIGALAGLEAYGGLAKAGVISGIASVVFIAIGAWMGGLNGATIGLSLSAFIRCFAHNWFLRIATKIQGIKLQYRGSLHQEKEIIFKFALPGTMAGYFSIPMFWLANSFLVRQPGGYEQMALYSAANSLRILVLFLPNVMNNVGLSVLNNEKGKGDVAHYQRVYKSNVLHIFLVSLGSVIIVGILGRYILQLFGKDFGAAHFILWILLFSTIFEGLSIGVYQYIQSKAKIWFSLFSINIPRETFYAVAAYFLVQSHGGMGLAMAYLGSTILGLVLHFSLVFFLYKRNI